jgi:TolB-like protein
MDAEQAPAAPSVFVSYSRDDLKLVRPIIERIEAAGYPVWWDGMLSPGERFANSTEAALEGARAVVVLWSAKSVASHWVHDEATRGRDRGCLVPLSVDGSKPPLGFRQFQTYSVNPKRAATDPGVTAMLQAIAALHDGPAQKPVTVLRSKGLNRRAALIGGGIAAAGALGGGLWWSGVLSSGARANSVAVLPFANLSGDSESNYFSAGLSAEVRSQLAAEPLLAVAAQTSSAKFAKDKQDASSISRALKVAFVLEGTVRRDASQVRASVELIEGATGLSRWAKTFDSELSGAFAVQEQIAEAVVAELTRQMAASGAKGSNKELGGTNSFAAYDAYLRGLDQFALESGRDSDDLALKSFRAAVAEDAQFALAQAALARTLVVFGNIYDQGAARRARYDEAIAIARKAVQLAPNLAAAQATLGFALIDGRLDARGARQPYRLSYELARGDADILGRFGNFEARCGRFDSALPAVRRAAELDPLNARAFRQIGQVEYSARNYAGVSAPILQALRLNPEMSNAWATLGFAKLMQGDLGAAEAAFSKEKSNAFRLPGLTLVAIKQGRNDEAEKRLAELTESEGDNSLFQRAQIMTLWGRTEQALSLLESGYSGLDAGLIQIRTDPLLDPLRGEPRFIRLVNAIGFD